jgi:hypothetical protein
VKSIQGVILPFVIGMIITWRHTPTTVYTDVAGLLFVFIDMQNVLVLLLLFWKLLGMVEMFKQFSLCHWTVQTYVM